jgi:hypothetical protein
MQNSGHDLRLCTRLDGRQDERGQVKQLKAVGCGKIFREKITDTVADRL